MRDRHANDLSGIVAARERRVGSFDPQMHVMADELQPRIAHEHAGTKSGFAEDLKTVADAEHQAAAACESPHRVPDRRACGGGAAAQIIPIGKLPGRRLAMPSTPSDFSAPSMALPWGSRMPDFSVTVTRAFTDQASALHQHRTGARGPFVLHQDAQPFCDLRVRLQEAAEIAAKTILVELLVRLDVP